MTCPLHPGGAYGCQHCNQQARARANARAYELDSLRAELAALKAKHAAALQSAKERQREADLAIVRTTPCDCEHGCAMDSAVDEVHDRLKGTPLVTEEE